jgi:hypothetical protein
MREAPEYMSMLRFRGGPWNGFVMDYGERVRPRDSLDLASGHHADRGSYLLDVWAGAYVWADGPVVASSTVTSGVAP